MRRALAMAMACGLLVVCSVTDSRTFKKIPDNEFPAGLRVTIPPTTTTTTTTTTIPGPTTTEVTTTTPEQPSEVVQVFYVQGAVLRAVSIRETSPVSPQRKLFDLVERLGMISDQLRLATVLSPDAFLLSHLERGVITIELGTSIDSVLPEDLPLFFAQIVLTALAPSRQGQVVFTQGAKPYPPVRADQTVLEPGAPVAWEDYAELIIGEVQPPVSTTTTTTTTTTLFGPP